MSSSATFILTDFRHFSKRAFSRLSMAKHADGNEFLPEAVFRRAVKAQEAFTW
jgi:hypothetical protein